VVDPLRIMLDQTRALLQAGPVTLETLPRGLVADWTARDGRALLQVVPRDDQGDNASLRRFAEVIQKIAPDATGRPISISASGDTVVEAFLQAGVYSILAITLLLAVVLRRARDVILTMLPVLLSGLLTFATCAALDLPLNFTNIIALPLLFGIGVAFNIYFVLAWRAGETGMLQSSLMRAVVFSALTTATAFGALWLSSHPGTASMGRLLMISLGWELLVTMLFRPALLARPPAKPETP
jgi:predicted RND superfamily exporter protein